ncbi:unnamed protein product, partial [Amoebophrya sp. A25]|eukprot:GSA25T00022591001.1
MTTAVQNIAKGAVVFSGGTKGLPEEAAKAAAQTDPLFALAPLVPDILPLRKWGEKCCQTLVSASERLAEAPREFHRKDLHVPELALVKMEVPPTSKRHLQSICASWAAWGDIALSNARFQLWKTVESGSSAKMNEEMARGRRSKGLD